MMKKVFSLALAALMLLSLPSCRMPEKQDPFKEILEENPEMELPKSEIMEVNPEDIPQFEINDTIDGYESEEIIPLPATTRRPRHRIRLFPIFGKTQETPLHALHAAASILWKGQ